MDYPQYHICRLTNLDDYSLRIQMWDADSNHAEVTYERFRLTDEVTYNLEVGDFVVPNAYGLMDELEELNGAPFSIVTSGMCDAWLGPWW